MKTCQMCRGVVDLPPDMAFCWICAQSLRILLAEMAEKRGSEQERRIAKLALERMKAWEPRL